MAQLNLPFGVRVANNDPLDADRYVAPDIATRDLLITNGRAYVGLQVYVSGSTNKLYILKDMTPTWEEVGGAADITSLSTALSVEVSDRTSGDESLSTIISSEVSNIISGYGSLSSTISSEISNETSNRMSGDASLSIAISTVSGATFDIDSVIDNGQVLGMVGGELTGVTYSTIVSSEESIRISVDESLSTVLSTEISDRTGGDISLSTALSSGDSSLSTAVESKLSGLTSNILYWDSSTKAYTPYPNDMAANSSGKLYFGTDYVSASDQRLNYTGGLYVNASTNSGLQGFSDSAEGVYGTSNTGDGGVFSSVNGNGVFGTTNSNINAGGRFVTYGSSNALEAEGNEGVAAFMVKSATLTTDDNNNLVNLYRITDGDGTYSNNSDIIHIVDDPTNTTYISGSTIKALMGTNVRIDMNPRVSNTGTSVAYMFDTETNLTEDGAKLLSLRNYGNDKFTVDKNGQVDVFNNKIVNVSTPTIDTDVANKAYVDAIAQGVAIHAPVHVVSTSDLSLTGITGQIDGHTLNDGEFVLVAGQTDKRQNGIYIAHTGTTVWERRPDADGTPPNEIALGDFVFVQSGVTYNNTGWAIGNTDAPTGQTYIMPDVDTQEWFKISSPGSYSTDGQGIELLGNQFYLELDGTTLYKSSTGLRLDNTLSTSISTSAAGVTSLSTALSGEISTRGSVDSSLSSAVSTEISTRTNLNNTFLKLSGGTLTGGITGTTINLTNEIISANTRKITLFDITSGSTSYWNMNSGCSARLYLTGATTLSISNAVSGDNGTLIVIQGTTGDITFPAISKYAGGTPITLSGGGQLDILSFYYDGTNYYWNIGKNYA